MRGEIRDMVTGQEICPCPPEGFPVEEKEDAFGYLTRWRLSRAETFAPMQG